MPTDIYPKAVATYNQMNALLAEIKQGTYAPVYWLEGEEAFYLNRILACFEEIIAASDKLKVNKHLLYGKETTLGEVLLLARQMSLQGERQFILVREAQDLPDWKQKDLQKSLMEYLKMPSPYSILVFAYHAKGMVYASKRTADSLPHALSEQAKCFHARKSYENELPDAIQRYVKECGYGIGMKAVMILTEHIGNDLARIAHALEAVFLHVEKDAMISEELIKRYVGISREYNLFELQKAIGAGDNALAHRIVMYFLANTRDFDPVQVVANLFSYFAKLLAIHGTGTGVSNDRLASKLGVHPYFVREYKQAYMRYELVGVKRAICWLQWADKHIKGIRGGDMTKDMVLRELIDGILHKEKCFE